MSRMEKNRKLRDITKGVTTPLVGLRSGTVRPSGEDVDSAPGDDEVFPSTGKLILENDEMSGKISKIQDEHVKSVIKDIYVKIKEEMMKIESSLNSIMRGTSESKENMKTLEVIADTLREEVRSNKKKIESLKTTRMLSSTRTQPEVVKTVSYPKVQIRDDSERSEREKTKDRGRSTGNTTSSITYLENNIRSIISRIERITGRKIDEKSPEYHILDAYEREKTDVEKLLDICYAALEKYSDKEMVDEELCEEANRTLQRAENWLGNVFKLYSEKGLSSTAGPKDIEVQVPKFSHDATTTVYEFLTAFDMKFQNKGSNQQRAEIMWSSYLEEKIKTETESLRHNISQLREYLIETYGDIHTVTDGILKVIEKLSIPQIEDYKGTATYLTKLLSAIQKIDKLKEESKIDQKAWEAVVLAPHFMGRLINLLHPSLELEFTKQLGRAGLNSKKIFGISAFQELISFCSENSTAMGRLAERVDKNQGAKQKETEKPQKTAHAFRSEEKDYERDEYQQNDEKIEEETVYYTNNNGWYNPKWKKPCPLKNHDHELGTCKIFMAMKPYRRKEAVGKKICWTCLDPREKCLKKMEGSNNQQKCPNEKKIDQELICPQCREYVHENKGDFSPSNVLFCTYYKHRRPDPRRLVKQLSNLLKSRIHELMLKPKEKLSKENEVKVKANDIVLFLSNETSTEKDWKLGRVIETDGGKARIYYMKKNKENLHSWESQSDPSGMSL